MRQALPLLLLLVATLMTARDAARIEPWRGATATAEARVECEAALSTTRVGTIAGDGLERSPRSGRDGAAGRRGTPNTASGNRIGQRAEARGERDGRRLCALPRSSLLA